MLVSESEVLHWQECDFDFFSFPFVWSLSFLIYLGLFIKFLTQFYTSHTAAPHDISISPLRGTFHMY